MISEYELRNYIEKHGDKLGITYNNKDGLIYNKDGQICSMSKYLEMYRLKTGQSFTSIYRCPGTLLNIIRCDKCGTVIFSYDDENYDDNLRCPTCTDYETDFKYWTKEDIESDDKKKATIETYEELTRKENERYYREKKRGKKDSEITKHKIHISLYTIEFGLECDDISESYFNGLRYGIRVWKKKDKNALYHTLHKHIIIPLSWSQLYYRHIYKHLGKCNPDLRSKWYIGKAIESIR